MEFRLICYDLDTIKSLFSNINGFNHIDRGLKSPATLLILILLTLKWVVIGLTLPHPKKTKMVYSKMKRCIKCKEECQSLENKTLKLECCTCQGVKIRLLCPHCNDTLRSEYVLSSGIHYWYKLKYEFNILKYMKAYHTDFNKHDKSHFAMSKHDDEIILAVRQMGTHIFNITDRKTDVITGERTLENFTDNFNVWIIKNGEIFFYMTKGKIEYLPKYYIERKFNDIYNDLVKTLEKLNDKSSCVSCGINGCASVSEGETLCCRCFDPDDRDEDCKICMDR